MPDQSQHTCDPLDNVIPRPTQEEVDAVAHFLEAVGEMKRSPFFIEEYASLSISMKEGATRQEVTAQFPDPSVMRGVLVPFRRVWQQNEPCHFTRISNILKKHMPIFRSFIDPLEEKKDEDAVNQFPNWKNHLLSNRDLIDVWLNTRFLHVGNSKKIGRFDRADFESLEKQIGTVLFEYYFLCAVNRFGIYFFNIKPFAERFLSKAAQEGKTPSFSSDSHTSQTGIQRSTPGYTPDTETQSHRAWCLRRRRSFSGFNEFLGLTDLTDQETADSVEQCTSFDEFLESVGISDVAQIEFEMPKNYTFTAVRTVLDDQMTAFRNRKFRRGFVGKDNTSKYTFAGDALPIIRDHYISFRKALKNTDQ